MAAGAYAPNFHEGSRSEYLAQYVFSMFGSSAPVLHQEDYGIDLYCTLTERKGQRAWPVAYYSVQIKSNEDPWEFGQPESVQWVVEYPAALLLCVIDKGEARVRVYQTLARFGAAVAAELPDRMALVPGQPGKSRTFSPATDGSFPMGAPILEFKVEDLLDDEKFALFREVLKFWVLIDQHNVRLYEMGMRSVSMPGEYTTNEIPFAANARYFLNYAPPGTRARAEETAEELLQWLARVRFNDGDFLGTLLAILALRHRNSDALRIGGDLFVQLRGSTRLDAAMGTHPRDPGDYVFAPYDKLLTDLREKVSPAEAGSGG
jgi:hypothetical protein